VRNTFIAMTEANNALFITVRKNRSYFSWQFLDADSVCIQVLSDTEFVMYRGNCLKVYRFGRKFYASATRYRGLRDGIYLLDRTEGEKYVFRFISALQGKA
jgi:hypothetical protein